MALRIVQKKGLLFSYGEWTEVTPANPPVSDQGFQSAGGNRVRSVGKPGKRTGYHRRGVRIVPLVSIGKGRDDPGDVEVLHLRLASSEISATYVPPSSIPLTYNYRR